MSGADDEEGASARQLARRGTRELGVSSARLANTLMKLPASSLAKLGLDEDLREDVARARAVTAQIARRRAERSLAGSLRRVDLVALATRIENVRATGLGDPRRLHAAERWREQLIATDGAQAAFRTAFPTANLLPLPRLIEAARLERTSGKPPGAARALFRHITAVMDAAEAAASRDAEPGEATDDDDEADADDDDDDADQD